MTSKSIIKTYKSWTFTKEALDNFCSKVCKIESDRQCLYYISQGPLTINLSTAESQLRFEPAWDICLICPRSGSGV